MLPITLNLAKTCKNSNNLTRGGKLRAREKKLRELGISFTIIETPFDKIIFRNFGVVLIVGLDQDTSAKLYKKAKAAGCLVNVEDNKKYCDFFFQSFIKRGDLLLSVSTNGKTPGTAKIIRDKIADLFPEIWGERINKIAQLRVEWKTTGLTYEQVNIKTKEYIRDNNWLDYRYHISDSVKINISHKFLAFP